MDFYIESVIALCQQEDGDKYVYGAEVDLHNPNPPGPFDCSELTQWSTYVASGGTLALPDGSYNQMRFCQQKGTEISIEEGILTKGALLFMQWTGEHHVAFSLGNGLTIEARGSKYGVGSWNSRGRPWNHAARVPGFLYGAAPTPPSPVVTPVDSGTEINFMALPTLKRGSNGQYVRNLQGLLAAAGRSIKIDGDFGPGTEAVLKSWQGAAGIGVDGVCGQQTWHHIIGA